MRRRLPAGLRWRLLLALLATSAVTLGATALVVLPPLQDRLRDQSVEEPRGRRRAANTSGVRARARPQLREDDAPGWRTYRHRAARGPPNELNSQADARVLVLDDSAACRATRPRPPPGFVYDSEFTRPAAAARCRVAIAGHVRRRR